jgi:hypothetical protein
MHRSFHKLPPQELLSAVSEGLAKKAQEYQQVRDHWRACNVGVIRYAGEGGVCPHQAGRHITDLVKSGATRWNVLRKFPELAHRDLNRHVLQCMLRQKEARDAG